MVLNEALSLGQSHPPLCFMSLHFLRAWQHRRMPPWGHLVSSISYDGAATTSGSVSGSVSETASSILVLQKMRKECSAMTH